jgi:DNA invertase Pin-like site-specific DNA recombinase
MNPSLLYIRVSSKEQEKEGFSLDAQEKLGYDYANRKDLKIIKVWKVSESAWKEEREFFNEMIVYAQKHKEITDIIFDVTDRMTRNDLDKYKIYKLIKEYDKTMHFSRTGKTFNKKSGSDDEFMLDIEVAFAKKWSNDISTKTKMGMQEKAEQGIFPSYAPLGYINNRITKLIEVDSLRAPYITRAFELCSTGRYSLRMIRDLLYKEGFRTLKGAKVHLSAIEKTLKNPIYYGYFKWNDKIYKGNHSPIISKELFDKTQSALKSKNRPNITWKNEFAFKNLLNCGRCGCNITSALYKNRYIYYHCTFSKGKCGNPYIREDRLAEKFGEEVVKKVSIDKQHADWLKEALIKRHKNRDSDKEKQIIALKKQHNRINNRLDRLYNDKLDGIITEDCWKQKDAEFRQEKVNLECSLSRFQNFNGNYFEDGLRIFELSQHLYPLYVSTDFEKKAKIVKILTSNCSINDLTLYPTYRKPFDTMVKWLSCPDWLPAPETQRIFASAKLRIPVYMQFVKRQLVMITGELPYNLKTDKRITKKLLKQAQPIIRRPSPLQEALKYAEVLKEPSIVSRAQVGERFSVSRARVCQMLNLLEMDYSIQKYLLSIENVKEHNYFTERKLRQIAIIKDNHEQIREFSELVNDMRFELDKDF